ncbi:RNA polymerase sigma factor [Algoriphagus halophytocola]|uniref:RNA polymerase sigma factor n=1 Tax=Algoriphagus halophytocola TaxID=2991499 RepID=A0ABY6MLL7_9BACT|nr:MULTISPECIES: RNA polymerase sigma factor [unclassified Algoriphagus]UZD24662.1 RNA polymerase sigma factor [Algoriphagus sp. TR-M5]WBL42030.1 RNA polymerase sigma factor [Algoriphagus sp. TR-M9]
MNNQKLDTNLIKNILQGDRTAQFRLFELTKEMLYSTCYRIISDEDEANDALQDSYVEIFQKLHTLKHPEALLGWMKTITVRKAIQQHKKKIHFEEIDERNLEPSEEFDAWFDAELLDQAIQSLPNGARSVFLIVSVEGYSHKESAQLLGISESTSKSQLNYAKTLLKKRITKLLQA